MKTRKLVRTALGSAAIAAAIALGGCDTESVMMSATTNAKATRPIPDKLLADMDKKNIDPQAPMLVRLFKQEAELEVWKQDREGRFTLVKTYPICRWSGDLGPKVREGDRQAPEGFYTINPSQMNPLSSYYLSFNIGYPNAYDRSLGHTGSDLMVHGDCSSRGCYAMTDAQIGEIYAMGREAFFGGQRAFQVQAYPFRMTPVNLAKHRNNPNMPFWKMLKEGYDHFEVTHLEPKVDFCEHRYVFNAQAPAGAPHAPMFNASAACPVYQVPADIEAAVREKQHEDEVRYAELVQRGTPVARLNSGIDGGMNRVFAARVQGGQTGLSDPEEFSLTNVLSLPSSSQEQAPALVGNVNPPRAPDAQPAVAVAAAPVAAPAAPKVAAAAPAPAPAATTQPAPKVAAANGAVSGGFFSSLSRKIGLKKGDTTTTASTPAATPPAQPHTQQADAQPAAKPAPANSGEQTLAGAQPALPTNSFDNRWSSLH